MPQQSEFKVCPDRLNSAGEMIASCKSKAEGLAQRLEEIRRGLKGSASSTGQVESAVAALQESILNQARRIDRAASCVKFSALRYKDAERAIVTKAGAASAGAGSTAAGASSGKGAAPSGGTSPGGDKKPSGKKKPSKNGASVGIGVGAGAGAVTKWISNYQKKGKSGWKDGWKWKSRSDSYGDALVRQEGKKKEVLVYSEHSYEKSSVSFLNTTKIKPWKLKEGGNKLDKLATKIKKGISSINKPFKKGNILRHKDDGAKTKDKSKKNLINDAGSARSKGGGKDAGSVKDKGKVKDAGAGGKDKAGKDKGGKDKAGKDKGGKDKAGKSKMDDPRDWSKRVWERRDAKDPAHPGKKQLTRLLDKEDRKKNKFAKDVMGAQLVQWKKEVGWEAIGAGVKKKGEFGQASASVSLLKAQAGVSAGAGVYYVIKDGKRVKAVGADAKAGASFSLLHGQAKAEGGLTPKAVKDVLGKDFELIGGSASAEGKVGHVEANAGASCRIMDGKVDVSLSGDAGAYACKGSVSGKANLLGVKVGGSVEGNVGFGVSGKVGFSGGKLRCEFGASLGLGFKVKFDIDIQGAVDAVKNGVTKAAQAIGNAAKAVGNAVATGAKAVWNALTSW